MDADLKRGPAPTAEKIGVTAVLLSPSRVYGALAARGTLHRLLWGLSAAVVLHGLMTGMLVPGGGRAVLATVSAANALGMALLSSLLGLVALKMVGARRSGLAVVAPCVAYGFGVTLLVSWIPGAFWFTEPWKWGVIGTGFRELGRVSGRRAFAAVGLILVALVALFKGIFMLQGV
ncbi:hypothetical protein [Desulfoluna butyratoxydans]|uniref:Yip1 domain-containing protein n=1 Tax=Desulfoluna butyratoxydans TaxID=231438 RepID=A0A4U8YJ20_9BACT|nr:hypothetical protein [Desulfoluna butyratoxydans]VFQ43400.1 hypothetical protein MSL71_10290 [Desulfoluna butyratoxydans]